MTVQRVIVATVLMSVFAHGMSAAPLFRRYAKIVESLPANAPENEEVSLVPIRGADPQNRGQEE